MDQPRTLVGVRASSTCSFGTMPVAAGSMANALLMGNPLLFGLRALQQRDPRGKVPPAVPDFHIRGERPVDFLPSARHPVSGMLRDVEAVHGLRHVALPGGVDKVISSGPHDRLPRIQGT